MQDQKKKEDNHGAKRRVEVANHHSGHVPVIHNDGPTKPPPDEPDSLI